jgi:quercetin dioxygenase-like cupin family protein
LPTWCLVRRNGHDGIGPTIWTFEYETGEEMMRRSVVAATVVVFAGMGLAFAQQGPNVNALVLEQPVSGVPDKVFTLITAEFPPGIGTGRHTHPGDEYGTVVEGAVVTRQEGGEWKTVEAGQSYYVPAGVVHETKNMGEKTARTYNGFIIEKGKPRATPAP